MDKIPSTFCWSKMGAESGEELAAIICRKEWERQLGSGYFFWGVGQSLGNNAQSVASEIESLYAIFSPMLSKARSIDAAPDRVVLWNAWIDSQGIVRQLPMHCFITSRASLPSGKQKKRHYALVCFSEKKLNAQNNDTYVFPKYLRNVRTNKPLGSSQVTAVVRAVDREDENVRKKSYPISFTAELHVPYCIQLAQPILLSTDDLVEMQLITYSGNIELWSSLVKRIRSHQVEEQRQKREVNLVIYDDSPASLRLSTNSNNLNFLEGKVSS